MPAIIFRNPEYHKASGIVYYDLNDHILGFGSTGNNFLIKIGDYPDYTNVLNPKTFKRERSANNIKRYSSGSGSVSNNYLNANLPLVNIPNWASTISIRFGNPTGATTYDVTTAYITASGGALEQAEYGEINAKPNAVRIYGAEICHTSASTGVVGSGATGWSSFIYLENLSIPMVRNPGPSGYTAKIGSTGVPANIHDWHFAFTISPLTLNSVPLMPLSCIVEYL